MIWLSAGLGLASVAMFFASSRISDRPGADRAPIMVGGIGFALMIAAALTSPAVIGDQSECINYGVRAESC